VHIMDSRSVIKDAGQLSENPATQWRGSYHRGLCRAFSSALRSGDVSRLIGVCRDLGIGVVAVDLPDDQVVDFWSGHVGNRHAELREQSNRFASAGWAEGPDTQWECQVYIASRYCPDPNASTDQRDERWRGCPVLSGLHNSALTDNDPARLHPYMRPGRPPTPREGKAPHSPRLLAALLAFRFVHVPPIFLAAPARSPLSCRSDHALQRPEGAPLGARRPLWADHSPLSLPPRRTLRRVNNEAPAPAP
jgi:hypothetical protein